METILILRQTNGQVEKAQQEALENLEVHICSDIMAVFVGEVTDREVKMRANEWVLTDGNRKLYVVCEEGNDVSLKNECLVNSIVEAIASIFGITDASQFARLIQAADDQQRLALLSSLLGETPEQVQEQLTSMRESIQKKAKGLASIAPEPVPQKPPHPSEPEDNEAPIAPEKGTTRKELNPNIPVTVEPLVHTPTPPGQIRLRVVSKTKENKCFKLRSGFRASGEEAEVVTFLFECNEGRFPVRVGHMQGLEGAGCDILSFESSELAQAVIERREKDPIVKACRLIEVKGRKDRHARIAIHGYEYDAATTHAIKYFFYRVYKDEETDTWQVAILHNPAHSYSAHVQTLVVDLEIAEALAAATRLEVNPRSQPHPAPIVRFHTLGRVEYARSGASLPKKFYDEIYPLALFVRCEFSEFPDALVSPNLSNDNFDATIVLPGPHREVFIEITRAKDGYDESLRDEVLARQGHVSLTGPITKISGRRAAPNRLVEVKSDFVPHEEMLAKHLALVSDVVRAKAHRQYGKDFILLVVVDDYLPFCSESDQAKLHEVVTSTLLSPDLDFASLVILGISGKLLISYPLPRYCTDDDGALIPTLRGGRDAPQHVLDNSDGGDVLRASVRGE